MTIRLPKLSDGVIIGYQQTAYANRNIKWETTTITDIGFDLQVFDGLSVTFDWYKRLLMTYCVLHKCRVYSDFLLRR